MNRLRWIIASDIHGSAYYCEKLLEAFEKEKADKIALLGDILYHGPRNDLPQDYNPKKVAQMLNGIKNRIICVKGNCDAEVDQLLLEFPILSETAVLDNGTHAIYLTHGHKYNIDNPLPMQQGDILIYGHTHVPLDEERDGIRYYNPGSVSIPKNMSSHGYMVFENGRFDFKALE